MSTATKTVSSVANLLDKPRKPLQIFPMVAAITADMGRLCDMGDGVTGWPGPQSLAARTMLDRAMIENLTRGTPAHAVIALIWELEDMPPEQRDHDGYGTADAAVKALSDVIAELGVDY